MEEETLNRKLIDIVSNLPIIYNQFHPDKKNKNKNESAWKEVAAKMNSSGIFVFKTFHLIIFYCYTLSTAQISLLIFLS